MAESKANFGHQTMIKKSLTCKINKLPKFSEQYIYILVNWPCSSSFHPQRVDRVQYTSCNLLKFSVCAMHHCQWEMFDKKLISGIVDNTISAHSKLQINFFFLLLFFCNGSIKVLQTESHTGSSWNIPFGRQNCCCHTFFPMSPFFVIVTFTFKTSIVSC